MELVFEMRLTVFVFIVDGGRVLDRDDGDHVVGRGRDRGRHGRGGEKGRGDVLIDGQHWRLRFDIVLDNVLFFEIDI